MEGMGSLTAVIRRQLFCFCGDFVGFLYLGVTPRKFSNASVSSGMKTETAVEEVGLRIAVHSHTPYDSFYNA